MIAAPCWTVARLSKSICREFDYGYTSWSRDPATAGRASANPGDIPERLAIGARLQILKCPARLAP